MKHLALTILIAIIGFKSFAAESTDYKQQDFNTQAMELLVKNMDKMQLEGDIKPGEKLKPIIDDLLDFLAAKIFSIMDNDPDDYKGHIKDLSADCKQTSDLNMSAQCVLIIQYQPMGETGISFYVGLDKDKKPGSILNNRVQISRGD